MFTRRKARQTPEVSDGDGETASHDQTVSGTPGDDVGFEHREDYTRGPRRSAFFVLRRTVREFLDDGGTDLAAGLTYYSVLAMFPAMLVLLSLVGVVGQAEESVELILEVLAPLVSAERLEQIEPTLEGLASMDAAGTALVIGLLLALWTASGYVGAFSRAMNRVYEVEEGRPFWRLRPMQLLVTVSTVTLSAVVIVILVVTGPVAEAVGDAVGLGDDLVTVWGWAKWPVLAVVVMVNVALLYWATPNVDFTRFRLISPGAFVAIVVWLSASAGFGFYVANFARYDRTYGSIAGVVIALLWLWLTNVALVFGAELDAELERGRELQIGLAAEEALQLPVRDTRQIQKALARRADDFAKMREIRLAAAGPGDPADRPFGHR
jgi:membrane protein